MNEIVFIRVVSCHSVGPEAHAFAKLDHLQNSVPSCGDFVTLDKLVRHVMVTGIEHVSDGYRRAQGVSLRQFGHPLILVWLKDEPRCTRAAINHDDIRKEYEDNGWVRIEKTENLRLGDYSYGDIRERIPVANNTDQQECGVGSA